MIEYNLIPVLKDKSYDDTLCDYNKMKKIWLKIKWCTITKSAKTICWRFITMSWLKISIGGICFWNPDSYLWCSNVTNMLWYLTLHIICYRILSQIWGESVWGRRPKLHNVNQFWGDRPQIIYINPGFIWWRKLYTTY